MRALGLVVVGFVVWGASTVNAQSLCAYRSPEAAIRDARMTFSYRYYDDPATSGIDVDSGRISASYSQLDAAVHSGFALAAETDLALSGFVPTTWLGQGSCTYRLYPWGKGSLFGFGGLEAVASTEFARPGLDARAGLGYGRFTDVTPLAKAIAIDEELLFRGAIEEALSEGTVLALAHMIERAAEYPTAGGLLADMEAIVEFESGRQLDVWTLRAIEDLALATGSERRCGWALQAGVGYELLDPYDGVQDFIFAASGDAAFASSPRDQLLVHVSFSGPTALLAENTLLGSAAYVLDFAARETLTAEYALCRIQPAGGVVKTTHHASLGLALGLARGSLGLQVSVAHTSGDAGWSVDVSMSAALELL